MPGLRQRFNVASVKLLDRQIEQSVKRKVNTAFTDDLSTLRSALSVAAPRAIFRAAWMDRHILVECSVLHHDAMDGKRVTPERTLVYVRHAPIQ